jgi:acyl carrier protein
VTLDEIKQLLINELGILAPEADLKSVKPNASLREELDLDSFDLKRFIAAIDERFGVEVPEQDFAKLDTLDGCINYLAAKTLKAPPANLATRGGSRNAKL